MTTPDIWAKWPDDFMCPIGELDSAIREGRSDDIERVLVRSYDETGSPQRWTPIRKGEGVCPVCNGTTRVAPLTEQDAWMRTWRGGLSYYDPATDTKTCRNCGGQTMSGIATGVVRLRPDGTPCTHSWKGREAGRCYRIFTCIHGCGTSWDEDSGD